MATNDQILLEKVFEESRANVAPTMVADDYFEIFSAEQTLKPYDLSYEEIEAAIIDGGNDGGVDSMFLFANEELVKTDTDLSVYKKDVVLDLAILQSKNKD